MKKNMVEMNKNQAQIVLEGLDNYITEVKEFEQYIKTPNDIRKNLREERLEAEMLVKQIEALEWD